MCCTAVVLACARRRQIVSVRRLLVRAAVFTSDETYFHDVARGLYVYNVYDFIDGGGEKKRDGTKKKNEKKRKKGVDTVSTRHLCAGTPRRVTRAVNN